MKNKDIISTAPKRGRPKGSHDMIPREKRSDHDLQTKPGDISKMIAFESQWMDLPKVDTGNIEEIKDRIRLYFKECQAWDTRPGVAGLCSALGICRSTWYYWLNGQRREYREQLEPVNSMLESLLEQYGLQGKLNPATQIFLLKNNFGYKDVNDLVVGVPNNTNIWDNDEATIERLKKKYLDAGYDSNEYVTLDESRKNDTSEVIEDDN